MTLPHCCVRPSLGAHCYTTYGTVRRVCWHRWARFGAFQDVTLRLIAEALLPDGAGESRRTHGHVHYAHVRVHVYINYGRRDVPAGRALPTARDAAPPARRVCAPRVRLTEQPGRDRADPRDRGHAGRAGGGVRGDRRARRLRACAALPQRPDVDARRGSGPHLAHSSAHSHTVYQVC